MTPDPSEAESRNDDPWLQLVEPENGTAIVPLAPPISLQDWLSQKAEISLAGQIQRFPDASDLKTELRFLRFSLSASTTALLPLDRIRQVIKVQPQNLLTVPDMPEFVMGICNFHGEMLWMVDLSLQLGLQRTVIERDKLRLSADALAGLPQSQRNWMAIVVQAQSQSLGLLISQVIDIETYDLTQLKSPTIDLFPASLLPFIQGYLVRSSSPVLDANSLIADRRLQVHAA